MLLRVYGSLVVAGAVHTLSVASSLWVLPGPCPASATCAVSISRLMRGLVW